jgi:hypothetical protein
MVPKTDYPEKASSLADLIERLPAAVDRVEAALEGLTAEQCACTPFPGKWSIRQTVEHIALVSLGWTDIFYQAIDGVYPTPRATDLAWRAPLEAQAQESLAGALAVFRAHNTHIAEFLATLPPTDFLRPFQVVAFLTEPFLIKESINWGLVIHADYHLATVHRVRLALDLPLEWMAIYLTRYPKPTLM